MNQRAQTDQADPREAFCAFLRGARERRHVSLSYIARVTRIPPTSLERLESGAFDQLPADVFVRGFLRSYARCVGADPGDVLARYADCRAAEHRRRVTEEMQAQPGDSPVEPAAVEPAEVAVPGSSQGAPTARTRLQATSSFVARQLFEEEPASSRRGAVTLAVIIVVIVATLTMSYLLRRPSHVGNGVTHAPTPCEVAPGGAPESSSSDRCDVLASV